MILQNWWYTTLLNARVTFCHPLLEKIKTDFLVIGGGIAGLHAAQYLVDHKKRVILIERNICGGSSRKERWFFNAR